MSIANQQSKSRKRKINRSRCLSVEQLENRQVLASITGFEWDGSIATLTFGGVMEESTVEERGNYRLINQDLNQTVTPIEVIYDATTDSAAIDFGLLDVGTHVLGVNSTGVLDANGVGLPPELELITSVVGPESNKGLSVEQRELDRYRQIDWIFTARSPNIVVAGDVDGDGLTDLVTDIVADNEVKAFLGQSDGSFGSEVVTEIGDTTTLDLELTDVNGDGRDDAILIDLFEKVSIGQGATDGTFVNIANITTSDRAKDSVLHDFDKDGDPDLFVSVEDVGVVVFKNADGDFTVDQTLNIDADSGLAIDDVDGDGDFDVVALASAARKVTVAYGDGSTFSPSEINVTPDSPKKAEILDFDGDGDMDILYFHGNGELVFLENTGSRTFSEASRISTFNNPTDLTRLRVDGVETILVSKKDNDQRPTLQHFRLDSQGNLERIAMFSPGRPGSVNSVTTAELDRYNAVGRIEIETKMEITVEITDPTGVAISTITPGSDFVINSYVEDVRPQSDGVFAAFVDVPIDSALVEVRGPAVYGSAFPALREGTLNDDLLDELGATASSTPTGSGQHLLWSVTLRAKAVGDVTFTPDPADILPRHRPLLFGEDQPIGLSSINFVGDAVSILDGSWTNSREPLDVNNDGTVSPIDVLIVNNELNQPTVSDANGNLPSAGSPPPFWDVDEDGFVTPLDALIIINFLNRGGAEGEGSTVVLSLAVPMMNTSGERQMLPLSALVEIPRPMAIAPMMQENRSAAVDRFFARDEIKTRDDVESLFADKLVDNPLLAP